MKELCLRLGVELPRPDDKVHAYISLDKKPYPSSTGVDDPKLTMGP